MDPRHPSALFRPSDAGPSGSPPPDRPLAPETPPMWRESHPGAPSPLRLLCPKCQGDLVTYERQGIHLEQCRECRGIWLDRGELDRLIDAEGAFAGGARPQPPADGPSWADGRDDDRGRRRRGRDDDDRREDWDDEDDGRGDHGRRRSRFGDLFEGLMG